MARILLVEDDEFLVDIYSRVLVEGGYAIQVARDGEEALEHAAASPPDLILMDIQMPVMDGIAATRELKATKLAHIPIIALTNLQLPEEIDVALEAGCDGYIVKPDVPEDLVVELAFVLGNSSDEDGSAES